MAGLPPKVAAVYWTRWNSGLRLTQVPTAYNVLILFAATRGGNPGDIVWGQNDIAADIRTCMGRGQKVVLSVGGAGEGISFSSRDVSQRLVNGVVRINGELGGSQQSPVLAGVDFNTFEANATPNTTEYLWMAKELKRIFGSDFAITSPPAPWNEADKAFCKEMIAQGAMDYAGPQFYDGPGLSDPNYIISVTKAWITQVAGGDASKIIVGFGIADAPNYSSVDQIKTAWNAIKQAFPTIRGVFLWQHATDSAKGWPFANQVIPLVGAVTQLEVRPIPNPPSPTPGDTTPTGPAPSNPAQVMKIGTSTYPISGTNVARQTDQLIGYTRASGYRTTTNQWGAEVRVAGGKVVGVVDRQPTEVMLGTVIPRTGYVLSGHGAARLWLLKNATVGKLVSGTLPTPPKGGIEPDTEPEDDGLGDPEGLITEPPAEPEPEPEPVVDERTGEPLILHSNVNGCSYQTNPKYDENGEDQGLIARVKDKLTP